MKKRFLSTILAVCMVLTMLPLTGLTAFAAESGDFTYTVLSDGTAEITNYTGSATELTIPSQLDGYTVTSIGDFIFMYRDSLTSITIPNSVTSIGYRAFYNCSSLESIAFGNNVTSIGEDALYGCYSLTDITVSSANPSYSSEDGVLFNKDKTELIQYPLGKTETAYTIPSGVISIRNAAFSGCALESITIPDSVTSIGNSAFSWCASLTSVTLGNRVESIGERAFYWCTSLENITIPGSVTTIGNSAFERCSALSDLTLCDGVKSIGDSAFAETALTEVFIPSSVETISAYAFAECDALTGISVDSGNPNFSSRDGVLFNQDETQLLQYPTGKQDTSYAIPNSVTNIVYGAFARNDLLENVTIPNSVTSIGNSAFAHCNAFTSVTLPESVTSMEDYAFTWCESLTGITIPDSVTSIGYGALYGCDALTVYGHTGSVAEDYAAEWGIPFVALQDSTNDYSYTVLSEENKTCEITGYTGSAAVLIIPSQLDGYTVTSIGLNAFSNCNLLKNVTIPNSVTNIGVYAFYSCDLLASVTIGDSVTSIGDSAFAYCDSLEGISIPDSVTSIGDYAFQYCDLLESVTIGNGVLSIGNQAFADCGSLTSVTIGNAVTSIGEFAFADCGSLVSITIPDSVTSIGKGAFQSCDLLTSITLSNSVTSIEDYTFRWCDSLTSITIPDSVTSIGNEAFYSCDSLKSVSIGNGVTSIGNEAFYACSSLTNVTIGNSVTNIGDSAFSSCNSLTSITIPDSVTSIGGVAFSRCYSLTCITIPDSVMSIGNNAFFLCTSLVSITVGRGNPNYSSANGVLFNKDKTELIRYPAGKTDGVYTVPSSVTNIAEDAFSDCETLYCVYIPSSVTSIEGYLFSGRSHESSRIVGIAGSYAETYAAEKKIWFVADDGLLYISMPESAVPGETVDIPIYVEGADLGALQFTVQYDVDKLEYVALTEDAFEANAGMTVTNAQTPGALTVVSIAGSVPAGKLYMLQFRVKDTASGETDMTISFESASDDTIEGNTLTLAGGTWTLPIADTYTVRYDANGGSGAPSAQTKVEDQALTLSSTTPTRTGYTFLGWSSDASAASSTYAPGGTYTANADVTLYAVWQANAYTVVYNANGGNGTMSNSTHTYDVGKALNANRFTRNGYTFLGWSERDDATTPTYTDGQSVQNLATANGATVTLYAVWEKDPVTVTSISVAQQPTKTEYLQNEAFSAAGLTLRVAYSDGTSQTITSGFTVSTPDMATPGEKTVTVTYAGKTTNFTIYVQEPAAVDPNAAHVYAESIKARPGETIQIPLYVENNPGVAYVKFKVAYDSDKLDLISAEDQGIFKGIYTTSQTIDVNPYVLQWMNAGNATGDGCFVMLTFKVLDGAAEGDVSIRVTYDEAYNETLDDVAFTFTSPTVTIRDYTPGDINDDGVVNGKDGIILSQYLAEWGTEINLDAADVNGDGVVNGKDSIILSQYLAAWDVELGK